MSQQKTLISQAESYQEMGEYWDAHSLDEIWEQTEPAEFEVDITSALLKGEKYESDTSTHDKPDRADFDRPLAGSNGISHRFVTNIGTRVSGKDC